MYAYRPGTVVKAYPDGSALILWDQGEPQPEGMGHERVPARCLQVVRDEADPFFLSTSLKPMQVATYVEALDSFGYRKHAAVLSGLGTVMSDLQRGHDIPKTILKLLRFHMLDAHQELSHVETLDAIDAALALMPENADDLFDQVEAGRQKLRFHSHSEEAKIIALTAAVEALKIVADPAAKAEEISAALSRLFDFRLHLPDTQGTLTAVEAALARRGGCMNVVYHSSSQPQLQVTLTKRKKTEL